MTPDNRLVFTVFALALIVVLFAHWMYGPPAPRPADAPPEAFSAQRAIEHIEVTCQEPHPAGAVANDKVCDYIQGQLAALDIETEVIDRFKKVGGTRVNWWRAVLGRIRGTAPTRAFAVDAHFDSVPYGPGAADDMAGVAAMLETARALKAGPPLKNDVIFVFADEEEFNGGGARAFTEHAWFEDVGVMLGLEARGTRGPALMFETSPNNGFVVRELARSGVRPRASSLMFDVYDALPFGSDFGHYKHLVAGMNVAFVDRFAHYHTRLDCPENVSLASLQHMGDHVLGLAQHFGALELDDCYAPNAAYFNVLGSYMVVYPQSWNIVFTLLALACLAGAVVAGVVRKRLRAGGTLLGALLTIGAIVVGDVLIVGPSFFLYKQFGLTAIYSNNGYCASFALTAIACFLLFALLLRGRVRPEEAFAGALLWWAAFLVVLHIGLPGGACLATWPLVGASAGLLALCLTGSESGPSPRGLMLAAASAVPALVLLGPALVSFAYTLTPYGCVGLNGLVVLLFALFAPHIQTMSARAARWSTIAAGVAAVLVFGGAYLNNLPSAKSPKLTCLSYGVDFDAGEAYWLSADEALDVWLRQFFADDTARVPLTEFLPGDDQPYLKAPAPMPPFGKPVFEPVEDRVEGGKRYLRIHLDSPRDAQRTYLRVTSEAPVHEARILGAELEGATRAWSASFDILPREGAQLELTTDAGAPLTFLIREVSYGVPKFPGYEPRPDWMAVEPNRTLDFRRDLRSEHTLSICTVDLGAGPG